MASSNNIRKLQAYITSMPSLPTTVSKVMEICNNPKTSPRDLDKVISLDPVLMGKVLKLINSAYYGLQNQVTSLVRAIIMLGVNTVKNLALSTAVLDRLVDKSGFRALNMDGFWRHCLSVGAVAKMIARKRGIELQKLDEYFAAGLLHDIGKVPMNNVISDEYVRAMAVADRERIPLYQAERKAIEIDHTAIGGMIADAWHLDGAIADCIKYHHSLEEYEGENRDYLLTIIVANWYAAREELGFSGNLFPERPDDAIFEELGLSRDWLLDIDQLVNAELEKATVFLNLKN